MIGLEMKVSKFIQINVLCVFRKKNNFSDDFQDFFAFINSLAD
jgi:hypothetical protein